MLTTLLPGVRELRTPLAVGYVWLIAAWTALADKVPKSRPHDGIVANIWDLGSALGSTIMLAAVTFTAYMIGSILEIDPQGQIGFRLAKLFLRRRPFLLSSNAIQDVLGYIRDAKPAAGERDEDIGPWARDRLYSYQRFSPDRSDDTELAVLVEVQSEIPQIATRLQVTNAELFSKYDRLMAEASLRVNIAIPLAVALTLAIWQLGTPFVQRAALFLIVLGVGYFIVRQGFTRIVDGRDVIVQALVSLDEVRSRRLDDRIKKDSTLDSRLGGETDGAG